MSHANPLTKLGPSAMDTEFIHFIQFIHKFLKFEEMEYLIHYVWDMNSWIATIFSTVKLKFGNNLSRYIH